MMIQSIPIELADAWNLCFPVLVRIAHTVTHTAWAWTCGRCTGQTDRSHGNMAMERAGVVNQRQMVSTYLVLESKQVPQWSETVFDPDLER